MDQLPTPRQKAQAFSISFNAGGGGGGGNRNAQPKPKSKKQGPFKFLRKDEGHLAYGLSRADDDSTNESNSATRDGRGGQDSRSLREAIANDMRRGRSTDPFAEAVVAVPKRAPPPSAQQQQQETAAAKEKATTTNPKKPKMKPSWHSSLDDEDALDAPPSRNSRNENENAVASRGNGNDDGQGVEDHSYSRRIRDAPLRSTTQASERDDSAPPPVLAKTRAPRREEVEEPQEGSDSQHHDSDDDDNAPIVESTVAPSRTRGSAAQPSRVVRRDTSILDAPAADDDYRRAAPSVKNIGRTSASRMAHSIDDEISPDERGTRGSALQRNRRPQQTFQSDEGNGPARRRFQDPHPSELVDDDDMESYGPPTHRGNAQASANFFQRKAKDEGRPASQGSRVGATSMAETELIERLEEETRLTREERLSLQRMKQQLEKDRKAFEQSMYDAEAQLQTDKEELERIIADEKRNARKDLRQAEERNRILSQQFEREKSTTAKLERENETLRQQADRLAAQNKELTKQHRIELEKLRGEVSALTHRNAELLAMTREHQITALNSRTLKGAGVSHRTHEIVGRSHSRSSVSSASAEEQDDFEGGNDEGSDGYDDDNDRQFAATHSSSSKRLVSTESTTITNSSGGRRGGDDIDAQRKAQIARERRAREIEERIRAEEEERQLRKAQRDKEAQAKREEEELRKRRQLEAEEEARRKREEDEERKRAEKKRAQDEQEQRRAQQLQQQAAAAAAAARNSAAISSNSNAAPMLRPPVLAAAGLPNGRQLAPRRIPTADQLVADNEPIPVEDVPGDTIVSQTPHGGEPSTSSGNKREILYRSGKKEVFYSNGTRKVLLRSGHVTLYFTNGDVKRTFPSGKNTYWYAAAQTTHTQLPDGVQIFQFHSSGQTEKHRPDGTKEILYPDGIFKVILSDKGEETYFPDGTSQYAPPM